MGLENDLEVILKKPKIINKNISTNRNYDLPL